MVVAISAISYGSYVLQKLTKGQGGIVLAALLGGAYSSTVTTVVMAKRAAREHHPHLFAGGILMASRSDVRAAGDPAGAVQPGTDVAAMGAFSGIGGAGGGPWLALDAPRR